MQELCGMRTTSLLAFLPGPLGPRIVAPDRVQSIGAKLHCFEIWTNKLNCELILN